MTDLGNIADNTGRIFCCKQCGVVSGVKWEGIETVSPLKLARPLAMMKVIK